MKTPGCWVKGWEPERRRSFMRLSWGWGKRRSLHFASLRSG
jgi:hypothetical protein